MKADFAVTGRVPVDVDDGRVFAPGETVKGLDPAHPHNAALIDAGKLAALGTTAEPTVQEILDSAEADPSGAEQLLALERERSKPRKGVVEGLEALIQQRQEDS